MSQEGKKKFDFQSVQAVCIFAGGIIRDADGTWRSTKFDEGDNYGNLGDYVRPIAAALVYKYNPVIFILVVGGRGQYANNPEIPVISDMQKEELLKLGVPEKNIIVERNAGSTKESLERLSIAAFERQFYRIGIISNAYHVPRIRAMVEHIPDLEKKFKNFKIVFWAAEDIIQELDTTMNWNQIISDAYATEGMKKRVALEEKGIHDLLENRYTFKKYGK